MRSFEERSGHVVRKPIEMGTVKPLLLDTSSGVLQAKKVTMACRSCGSKDQTEFASEVSVHVLGLENVDKPTVLVFPRLLVCMNCGFTESTMTENELRLLGNGPASDVKAAG